MPHIFSWRPKLQVRLKKLSHHIGELGNTLSPGNSPPPRAILPQQDQHIDNDFIVDSAPKLSTLSDGEEETSYFFPRKPLDSSGSYTNNFEDASLMHNSDSNNGKRTRAVRFCEVVPDEPKITKLPPVCNVQPNRNPIVLINSMNEDYLTPDSTSSINNNNNIHNISNVIPNPVDYGQQQPNWRNINYDREYLESENQQPPRPARYSNSNGKNKPMNRANMILQQLRADDGIQSESEVSTTNESLARNSPFPLPKHAPTFGVNSIGAIYLQHNDEIKRSLLPANIHSMEQIKSLFLRSFPDLSHRYLNLPYVKEVRDRSVLKLKEHQVQNLNVTPSNSTPSPLPPPIQFINRPPTSIVDYVSEPEIDYDYNNSSNRFQTTSPYRAVQRPASVTPSIANEYKNKPFHNSGKASPMSRLPPLPSSPLSSNKFYNTSSCTSPINQPTSSQTNINDPYYYDYSSDSTASSSHIRSGSTTPVQIEKIDHRMENMERQLAGLSSLVHSALINTTNLNPTTQKDIMKLRKQIIDLQPVNLSTKDSDDEEFLNAVKLPLNNKHSNGDVTSFTKNSQQFEGGKKVNLYNKILNEAQKTQNDLKNLKRQAQDSLVIIKEAFYKVQEMLLDDTKTNLSTEQENNVKMNKLRKCHLEQLITLQSSLRF